MEPPELSSEMPKAATDLSKELNYAKIIKIFSHPDTMNLYSRQVAQLRRVSRHNPQGFMLGHLGDIREILLLSLGRVVDNHSEFEKPLASLVNLCKLPARRQRSNEELLPEGLKAVDGIYRALDDILRCGVLSIQIEAANALTEIAKGRRGTELKASKDTVSEIKVLGVAGAVKNDQRPKTRDLNQEMLRNSGVVDGCIAELLGVAKEMVERLDVEEEMTLNYESDLSSDDEEEIAIEGGGADTISGGNSGEIENADETSEILESPSVDPGDSTGDNNPEEPPAPPIKTQTNNQTAPPPPTKTPRLLLMSLLKLLTELSENEGNSALMISLGAEDVVMRIMDRLNDERDETLNMCVEILWNCLEHSAVKLDTGNPAKSRTELIKKCRQSNAMYRMSTPSNIATLCKHFRSLLQRGFRNKDKELRNEILILASLVARNKRGHEHFNSTGFVKLMCIYATVAEVGTDPDGDGEDVQHVDPHNFATVSPADIELKRILWNLLSDLARSNQEILGIVVESPLLHTLLMYLDTDLDGDGIPDDNDYADDEEEVPEGQDNPDGDEQEAVEAEIGGAGGSNIIARIPRTQLRVLQQQAITVLLNLAPRASEKFRALGGHVITLKFLDWCGASESNRDLVQGALMLLISVVGLPGLQEELGQLNAIRIMLGRFNDLSAPESLRADAVRIISRLCSGNPANQDNLRKHVGIAALVKELSEYCKHRRIICGKPKPKTETEKSKENSLKPMKQDEGSLMGGSAKEKVSILVVGVVDCIWNAVIGNKSSEARFLHVEGQDGLLDLLEICPALMRSQICGVLADLVKNDRSLPYLTAWRSDRSMMSAVQLLMVLWEEEEVRLRVQRNNGVIVDLWKPLGRHLGREEVPSRPDDFYNMAGNDPIGENASSLELAMEAAKTDQMGTTMAAFKKLEKALAAGQKRGGGNLERALRKSMAKDDIRGKIACCVEKIGWEEALKGLSAHERMTLTMCKNWLYFTEAECWMNVRDKSVGEMVKPILADKLLVSKHLEEAFENANTVREEQKVLFDEKVRVGEAAEAEFFNGIFKQRDQEINQHLIKKKAMMPKSLSKRKAEKEAKAAMLAKSLVKSAPNEGNNGTLPVKVEILDDGENTQNTQGENSQVDVIQGELNDHDLEFVSAEEKKE